MVKSTSHSIRFLKCFTAPTLFAATVLGFSAPARGAVNLGLFGSGPNPTSVSVSPGGTFSVTLNVSSTAEQLTGVDYYFSINGAAAGKVRLAGRAGQRSRGQHRVPAGAATLGARQLAARGRGDGAATGGPLSMRSFRFDGGEDPCSNSVTWQ